MSKKAQRLLEEQGGLCAYCGIDLTKDFNGKAEIDHAIPKAAFKRAGGGKFKDIRENLVACCRECNSAKADMPLGVFLATRLRSRALHWKKG